MNPTPTKAPIEYPDSDGKPMAKNTLQFQWIVTIKENLETQYANNPDVFVAGDLLWYPVEGNPKIRQAPDALVAFGRPKGYRGSYRQWEEGGIAPQVVFEVVSPGNRLGEMARKFAFYDRYGAEEYYVYDPDRNELLGWVRTNGQLLDLDDMDGWISPALGIRFDWDESLKIWHPDDSPFLTFTELAQERDRLRREHERAERDLKLANWEKNKALGEKEDLFAKKAATDRLVQEQAEELSRLRARIAQFKTQSIG